MGAIYHFSEEPGIVLFEPRTPAHRPEVLPLVWAIDEWHAPMYLFPRDCPRILFWPRADTTPADRERFWGDRDARMVACVEWAWLDRIRGAHLYRYRFDAAGFEDLDDAGMLVRRDAVRPLAVEPVGDLVAALRAANVELRLMPSLLPLRGMWDTTLHASGIRLRNAAGWDYTPSPPPPSIARTP
jgi:Family of unknown function (DUF6886)